MKTDERKEAEERFRMAFSMALRKDQMEVLMSKIESMPDYDFWQLAAEAVAQYERNPMGYKDFLEAQRKLQKKFGVTPENSAMGDRKLEWLSKEDSEALWIDVNKSKPSDSIFLTAADDDMIREVWKGSVKEKDNVPSDLFFSGDIPLMDCEITVDETDMPREKGGGEVVTYRVVVIPDYKERIETGCEDDAIRVAALVFSRGSRHFIYPIVVVKGFDYLLTGYPGFHGIQNPQVQETVSALIPAVYSCISTWYGIQISLLHPTIKEVFSHPREVRVYDPDPNAKKRKRRTRYIKRHVIKSDEIEKALCGGSERQFNRRTLVWYVIGHWRHYANGSKVFIKGYWKGVFRELKRNIDDGRDRQIVLPEGGSI